MLWLYYYVLFRGSHEMHSTFESNRIPWQDDISRKGKIKFSFISLIQLLSLPTPNELVGVKLNIITRINQRIETRIDQHVPAKIHHGRCNNLLKLVNTPVTAIGEHLNNLLCVMSFTMDSFIVISRAHSNYHL